MATVRIIATSETYRRAPYYFTPKVDEKTKKWNSGQDLNWKTQNDDGKKKFVLATEDDEKKARNIALVIDPNESYMVKHNMQFNMEVPSDVILLNFLKNYGDIVSDKKSNVVPGRHRYYVENTDDEAKDTVSKIDAEYAAMTEIKKMNAEERQDFARIIGVGGKVGSLTKTQVEAALLGRCKLDPEYIMSVLGDPNRKIKSFLKNLIEKNIVRMSNGKYMYENEILGLNEMSAIEFLKNPDNAKIVSEYERLLKSNKVTA